MSDMSNGKTYTEVVLEFTDRLSTVEHRMLDKQEEAELRALERHEKIMEAVSEVKTVAAIDRTSTKSLLRRDTIGYVWDSFNTLIATICIAYFWGRN